MKTIEIIDDGQDRYTLKCDTNILGRRYDNIAEELTIIKPAAEEGSACILIATYGGNVVDHIAVDSGRVDITSNLSQHESINIGFSFTRPDGYIKGSEVKQFKFLPAQKPDGFVPEVATQQVSVDYLISYGFVNAKLEDGVLSFQNTNGDTIVSVLISSEGLQVQSDWSENDNTQASYIKNKPTKLSQFENDEGFITNSNIDSKADKSYVDEELSKKQPLGNYATIDQLNTGLSEKQPIGDYATRTELTQGLSTKQPTGDYALKSEIPDVSQFITKTVNDLTYYYTKTEVDGKISLIPKFSIQVVDNLPVENISNTTVYLVRNVDDEASDLYTEYIYVNGEWEILGTQTLDLSNYVTTEALNNAISNFITEEDVDLLISTALEPYAKVSEIPDTSVYDNHILNTQNPHNVTAEQTGAYTKPLGGIPETDLSEDVQQKLNSNGAEENLLRQTYILNRQANITYGDMINLGYALGLTSGKEYFVKYKFNNIEYNATAKYEAPTGLPIEGGELCLCQSVSAEGMTMTFPMLLGVNSYNAAVEEYMNAAQNYGFMFVVDNHQITGDMVYTDDEDNSSIYLRALQSSDSGNSVGVELMSISPVSIFSLAFTNASLIENNLDFRNQNNELVGRVNFSGLLIPTGGTAGQILSKSTDTDNDVGWVNIPTGIDGTTFTPSVDSSGNLSWTNDGGKENPPTVNIKGEKGEQGVQGEQGIEYLAALRNFTNEYNIGDTTSINNNEFNRTPVVNDIFSTLCANKYYTTFKVLSVSDTSCSCQVIAKVNLQGAAGVDGADGVQDNEIIYRETLPTASADSPDFVQTTDGLAHKKSTASDGGLTYSYETLASQADITDIENQIGDISTILSSIVTVAEV